MVSSGSQSGRAGSTYSRDPSRSVVAWIPHRIATNRKIDPAAHACGTLAPRYWTGKLPASRGRPANSSGSRLAWNRSVASNMPSATWAASASWP